MIKLPHSFLLMALLFAACTIPEKKALLALPDRIDTLMASVPDFSGVVLTATQGQINYVKPFGFRDVNVHTKVDSSDIFELASISKQFTAMTIMMLKVEGKLNYDDPMDKFIPGLPYPAITIRHLLNHTSGLPDYQAIMDAYWDKTKVANNEDIIAYLKKYHPEKLFEPGNRYEYSNTGYVLLGTIAEKVSGKDFVRLCHERIFDKLGMSDTDMRTRETKDKLTNFAYGHVWTKERNQYVRADSFPSSNYTIWLGNRKGPGRISSTVFDLLRWDQALYSHQLVKKETMAEAFLPANLSNDSISQYGFGWMLRTHPTLGKVVYHTGDNPGYKTIIVRYVDRNKTIIILCNNAHAQFDEIVPGVERILESE